jgi:hypothetical protein
MAMVDKANEDDLGLSFPGKPSELRAISDEELAILYRKRRLRRQAPL